MEIQTNEFSISPLDYYKIVAINRLRRSWWISLGCILIAIFNLSDFGTKDFATFLILFGFIYPPFIFIYLYLWTTSSKNKSIFVKRQLTIDGKNIVAVDEDNTRNEILWKYVIRIVKRKTYWLLYISKGQFIYIPKAAFQSEIDINEFEKIIKTLPNNGKQA